MEIPTAPRPPAPTPWGRLVLSVIVLAPVTLFVLLPIGLGLDRYVMTSGSMSGGLAKGSVAFERVVPVSDVHVGDVITYRRPGHRDDLVTHRVVIVRADGLVTRADTAAHPDPWVLAPDGPTLSRVEFSVPLVGWVYLFFSWPAGWAITAAAAVTLVVLSWSRRGRAPAPVRDRVSDPGPTTAELATTSLSDTSRSDTPGTGAIGVKGE